jgi:hypothetical protein
MLLVTFARLGQFAVDSTDPPGRSYGDFQAIANDGTRWATRGGNQWTLYRPVGASEPASYTFDYATDHTHGDMWGDPEDNYIVGVIIAYRGVDITDPVGTLDGAGELIHMADWPEGDSDPGRQFEANTTISSGGSNGPESWNGAYWYSRVADALAVFVVTVDWSKLSTTHDGDPPVVYPDPPGDVEVTFPDGWTERTPAGSWLKIADGPPSEEHHPDFHDFLGSGTWRGKAVEGWDIGIYTLSSSTMATPDTSVDGVPFGLSASSIYMPVYAGGDGAPPPVPAGWYVGHPW